MSLLEPGTGPDKQLLLRPSHSENAGFNGSAFVSEEETRLKMGKSRIAIAVLWSISSSTFSAGEPRKPRISGFTDELAGHAARHTALVE